MDPTVKPITSGVIQNPSYVKQLKDDKQLSTLWILKSATDSESIKSTLEQNQFTVTVRDPTHLQVSGSTLSYANYLGTSFHKFSQNGTSCYAPSTPFVLQDQIIDILGLNSFPISASYVRQQTTRDIKNPFTLTQLTSLYNFPQNTLGDGVTIGIIELGGGYRQSDITQYIRSLGITTDPSITNVPIDNATNNPADTSGANLEVTLDVQLIAGLVPNANIRVYFCPNTDQGFYDGIYAAIQEECQVISISWGAPESSWLSSSLTSFNNLFQTAYNNSIVVCVAAGDHGSSDSLTGNNVDFPSSSPYVLSCGGTSIQTNNEKTKITAETVWNDGTNINATGGGISKVFAKPAYQNNVSFSLNNKRGVPDVAANADPNTGYRILYQGQPTVIGGTSAAAPLWAGLMAMIVQTNSGNITNTHQKLYYNPAVCHDITVGNNGSYAAKIGWDPCTGNGSPNGLSVLNLLTTLKPIVVFSSSVTSGVNPLSVSFTDSSLNSPTSWLWDFGDGSTSTSQNPSHTYVTNGSFTVKLTATNSSGSNSLPKPAFITVTPTLQPPVVSFSVSTANGITPLTVTFNNTTTNNPTTWLWQFGDGQTSTAKTPTHTYTTVGSFTVSLKATNAAGNNSLTKKHYIVTVLPPPKPVVSFTATPTTGFWPLQVTFTDTSQNSPKSWVWDFGDSSTTSKTQNPVHIYKRAGVYNVKLIATNESGSNTLIRHKLIVVKPTITPNLVPIAHFNANLSIGAAPLTVQFTDASTNKPTQWLWEFGSAAVSTVKNPMLTYINPGIYTVTLTVKNSYGSDTETKTGFIHVL
jgi:kumamolisin